MSAANVETAVRELLASGLTAQDVADHLRLHVVAVKAIAENRTTVSVAELAQDADAFFEVFGDDD